MTDSTQDTEPHICSNLVRKSATGMAFSLAIPSCICCLQRPTRGDMSSGARVVLMEPRHEPVHTGILPDPPLACP